jgi:chemotaxis protein CheY-P-specific phosphatase CheC
MTEKLKELTHFHNWVQVGLLRAVNAVGEFTGLKSEFSEPTIAIKHIEEISSDKGDEPSICLLQSISGKVRGFFLFAASNEIASNLVCTMNRQASFSTYLPESLLCQSFINEWANIFAGNFIACTPELEVIGLTPIEQTYDMSGAALDFIACQLGIEHHLIALGNTCVSFNSMPGGIQVWIIISPHSYFLSQEGESLE